jgi:hypothetical protein
LIRFGLLALVAVALLSGGVGRVQAQKKTAIASFGALTGMESDKAQADAKAWLQSVGKTDAASMKQFDSIWKNKNRNVLDKLADTFALGDATAAKLLKEAADPKHSAPTEVPAIFSDKNASAFFKSNLALAYARLLTQRRVFEQALDVLNTTKASAVADPGSFLFHKAVCLHGLLQKDDAKNIIDQMLVDVVDIPERYKTVAVLILLDMETWKSKDLGAVARLMDNSARMLDLDRPGPKTQKVQKEIIHRLDELIKELENKQKQDDQDSDPKPGEGKPGEGGGACPGGKPGGSGSGEQPGGQQPGNKGGKNPTAPLQNPAGANNGGEGKVDPVKLKKAVEQWGILPPAERQQLLQQLTEGLSPADQAIIEAYFRNIAKIKK